MSSSTPSPSQRSVCVCSPTRTRKEAGPPVFRDRCATFEGSASSQLERDESVAIDDEEASVGAEDTEEVECMRSTCDISIACGMSGRGLSWTNGVRMVLCLESG